jgi:flagellar biogenesis protein FliO
MQTLGDIVIGAILMLMWIAFVVFFIWGIKQMGEWWHQEKTAQAKQVECTIIYHTDKLEGK